MTKSRAFHRQVRRLSPRLSAAVICGVMAAGCTTAGSSGGTAPAEVTPPPLSPAAYQETLWTAGGTLKTAIAGIEGASPLEQLVGQVDSAADAVLGTVPRLSAVVPPTQYVAPQADLVSALNQFGTQLSELRTRIESHEFCTASSAMAALSNLSSAEALRRAAAVLGPAGVELSAALPAPETLPDRRESNGAVLRAPGSGKGYIKIENDADHDVVTTISQNGRAVGSIYVTHGDTAQLNNIPDGEYEIFYTGGKDWDGDEFTQSCTFRRLDKTADFVTTKTQYKYFSLVLHSSSGNVREVEVSPSSFPK